MTGKADEAKGRIKEAAGAITDNDQLRREGKIDQAAPHGHVKVIKRRPFEHASRRVLGGRGGVKEGRRLPDLRTGRG